MYVDFSQTTCILYYMHKVVPLTRQLISEISLNLLQLQVGFRDL